MIQRLTETQHWRKLQKDVDGLGSWETRKAV